MTGEKMIFEPSGLIKDPSDLKELEFWGPDGGIYRRIDKPNDPLKDQCLESGIKSDDSETVDA